LPIPKKLQLKRAIVNPLSSGVECFKWAFLAGMHYGDVQGSHRERIHKYKRFERWYDFSSTKFPATIRDVEKFELLNSHKGFAINIFGLYNDEKVLVKYLSKYTTDKRRIVVNLLFVKDDTDHPGHYLTITNIQRLLGKRNNHQKFLCFNCLAFLTSETKLKNHEKLCHEFETQRVKMPTETINGGTPYTNFRNHARMMKMDFVVYADFEALTTPPASEGCDYTDANDYQYHTPCGYGLVAIDCRQRKVLHDVYRGPDCIDRFITKIDSICTDFVRQIKRRIPMEELTPE
jgi:hypothetical protein